VCEVGGVYREVADYHAGECFGRGVVDVLEIQLYGNRKRDLTMGYTQDGGKSGEAVSCAM
jgi:hypothetical protein